jgi:ATP/maltotriose-dependent transcriptional regulator MalT
MIQHGLTRRGVLVGRAPELAGLERALERVGAGGSWVEIVGEPGIGKSRLLAELRDRAERHGYLVLDGRAAEFEQDVPFGLIIDALNDYLGALEPAWLRSFEDEATAELASIFPSLSWLAGGVSMRRVDAERYRVHYAIRALLERLSSRQPLVLTLDDVHWADPASIEVIAHLIRRFRGPLLAVLAWRQAPAQLAAALDTAMREGAGSTLELAPLSPGEAEALLDPAIDPATRAALYRESGGNPFYLEELTRASQRRAALADFTTNEESVAMTTPASVVTAIRGEVAGLSDATRRILDGAAIAGESFEPELVGAIAGTPEPAPLLALDELLEADLIRPTDSPRRFRFRHPIVRRAVYDSIPRGWRLDAHARAAAALAAAHAPAAVCAHHIERSAVPGDERAIQLLIDAARSVAARAPRTAGRWLLTALELLPASVERERRLVLLSEAAAAHTYAGTYEEALAALDQAFLLVPGEQPDRRAEIVAKIARTRRNTGQSFDSRALIAEALDSLPDPDSREALDLRIELALDFYYRGDFAQMRELAAGVLPPARQRDDLPTVALAATIASIADTSRDRVSDGLAELEEAHVAFAALPDQLLAERIDLAGYIGLAAVRVERTEDALAHVRRGIEVARATGQGAVIPGLLTLKASALLMSGQVLEALRVAETATDAAALSGNDQVIIWPLGAVTLAALSAGDVDRALRSAREALVRSQRLGETFLLGLAHLRLAGALHAAGDLASAREELLAIAAGPTRRLLDLSAAHGWDLLAHVHLDLGEETAAEAAVAAAEALVATVPLPLSTATVRCARAAVALARGDTALALASTEEAVELAERAGNPLIAARARVLSGRALAAAGHLDRAIAQLESAHATLSAYGAARETDAAARELRRLGCRVPRRARPRGEGAGLTALSPREREVVQQVALGKTNREIAGVLFLSEKTVGSHLARIFDKLGVRSRAALAALIGHEAGERAVGPPEDAPAPRGR